MRSIFFLLFIFSAPLAFAADTKAKADAPEPIYLGPGLDLMSPEEYKRVYREYIQQTILMGFPIVQGAAKACDQALITLFRQAGFFSYPVPTGAQRTERRERVIKDKFTEFYQGAGVAIQVIRHAKTKNLDRVVYLNTSSPRAAQKINELARNQLFELERDLRTGLEKVKTLPVGYPHPFLDPEGQGIFVKELKFNGQSDSCALVEFVDNAWVGGFMLDDSRCADTQRDADLTWEGKIAPAEFANRERERLRQASLASAKKRGIPDAAAKQLVDKGFQGDFGNDISMVGSAMRNLSQCNQLAMGGVKWKSRGAGEKSTDTPKNPGEGSTSSGAE